MSTQRPPSDAESRDDAAFVARLADAYAPPPMTPARRARFDARLAERVQRARLRFVPVLAAGAASLAIALFVVSQLTRNGPVAPAPGARSPSPASALVLAEALGSGSEFEEALPPEYQAIASLLGEP
jgi:hypothetical protein